MSDNPAAVKFWRSNAFSPFEWIVAGRYLRARRSDAFISVIATLTIAGVAIGVATLIVVMSVMNGFREELLSKILGLSGHFSAFPVETRLVDYEDTALRIEGVDGVVTAVSIVHGQALASSRTESTGVTVRGMTLSDIQKLPLLFSSVQLGAWIGWDENESIAIGYRLANRLGVTVGDAVTLVNPQGSTTPFGTTPQIRTYTVSVIFNLGMVEFDSYYLFMPMRPAQVYFKQFEDRLKEGVDPLPLDATDEQIDEAYERITWASAIEVFIENPDETDALRTPIQDGADRPLILTDWKQRNQTFFSALQVERIVMFTILSMIVIVAAFNIISSLVMLVKDKGADIAVLRTMGATRTAIMRIFCMTGTAIGFLGTGIGLVIGLILASNAEAIRAWTSEVLGVALFPPEVFFLSSLPSRIDPSEVTFVVLMALGLSFLATLYPAWRAAQYDPVEALRYE